MNIERKIHICDEDFLTAVFEAGLSEAHTPWWVSFQGNEDEITKSTEFVITYTDPDDWADEVSTKTITMQDMADAVQKLLATPHYHCGEVITDDIEDWDMCVADLVLQFAVFGDEVYG